MESSDAYIEIEPSQEGLSIQLSLLFRNSLVSYPQQDWSISEYYVDYVVSVDAIGDTKGVVAEVISRDGGILYKIYNVPQVNWQENYHARN